jgi:asparagine synthase (glutamine-hydrolysing)
LMRRALVGIVPNEILNRKRKAFIARGPLAAISGEWQNLLDLSRSMRTEWLGIIDSQQFLDALKAAARGHQVPLVPLLRTISTELWLRNLEKWGCVHPAPSSTTVAGARIVSERNQARSAVPSEYQALS